MFGAINYRAALDAGHATVGLHFAIRADSARFHVEMHFHLIAFLPVAVDGKVAVICKFSFLLPIDGHLIGEMLAVRVLVKVGWHGLPPYPARNADFQGKPARRIFGDAYGHVAIPRVFRCLRNAYVFARNAHLPFIGQEQVHVH